MTARMQTCPPSLNALDQARQCRSRIFTIVSRCHFETSSSPRLASMAHGTIVELSCSGRAVRSEAADTRVVPYAWLIHSASGNWTSGRRICR